ncbi:hypothetical protein BaRGS_00009517, partial [Batillaria attramentaria]
LQYFLPLRKLMNSSEFGNEVLSWTLSVERVCRVRVTHRHCVAGPHLSFPPIEVNHKRRAFIG